MKKIKNNNIVFSLLIILSVFINISCEREIDELKPATFPSIAEVFIDDFSSGLQYEAWGDVNAFDVDKEVTYKGSASMKFAVPNEGETGGYAGGLFYTTMPRDLTAYTALTFWIKASKAAEINEIAFGLNDGLKTTLDSIQVTTNWRKVIIPIPDPSKLKEVSSMLSYSEAPEDGLGYTFWIDEVKFEKLGTIAHPRPIISDGLDKEVTAVNGLSIQVDGLSVTYNMPDGLDQSVKAAPAYFDFVSSNNSVAMVDSVGQVSVLSAGTTTITAKLNGIDAEGSIMVESTGDFEHAPTPTEDAADVISVYSDAYTNVAIDYYNGYWMGDGQTTLTDYIEVDEDNILYYYNLNFVGIQFSESNIIDATGMTHLHLDVFVPNTINSGDKLKISVNSEAGLNGSFTVSAPELVSQNWISVDIPLSAVNIDNLYQIVFENSGTSLSAFYADNIYFYDDGSGGPVTDPTTAAPAPTPSSDDVISIFSDAYDDLEGSDYPVWDNQTTVLSNIPIAENPTLRLLTMNFQGVQLASPTDFSSMTHMHVDVWSPNFEKFSVKLVDFGADGNYGGGDDSDHQIDYLSPAQGQWLSYDIPLTDFTSLASAEHLAQIVFECLPTSTAKLYIDNIYFYNSGGGGPVSGPATAAPTPTKDPANVVSIYSDAYDDIAFDNFDAGWCGGAAVTPVTIQGNNTLKKKAGIDCQGIEFSSNKLDLSSYTHIHFDFYTDDVDLTGDVFNVKLVDYGGGSSESSALEVNINTGTTPAIVSGSWVSVDIDITSLGGVVTGNLTRSDVAQIGITTANLTNVWYDNIYLYK